MPMKGGTRIESAESGLAFVCDDCERKTFVDSVNHEMKVECENCGMEWEVIFQRDFGDREYTVFGRFEGERIFLHDIRARSPSDAVESVVELYENHRDDPRGEWAINEADRFLVMRTGEMELVNREEVDI